MDRIAPLSAATHHGSLTDLELLASGQDEAGAGDGNFGEAIVAATHDAILVMTHAGEILQANSAAERLFAAAKSAIRGKYFQKLIRLPADSLPADGHIAASNMIGYADHADGKSIKVEISIVQLALPDHILFAAQLRDISAHSELQTQLHQLAYFDQVTQLPNRYATLNRIGEMMAEDAPFTVWHMNLDRFRILKNSLGHDFGERVLVAIADRIKSLLDQGMWLSRLGGDEFVLILPALNAETIKTVSTRLQTSLSRDLVIDGRDVHLKASIGIVESSPAYNEPAQMLSDAEIAAFQAKIAGGGTYAVFDQPMRDVLMDLQQTEADLRAAVKQSNQLWVAYQPIVDLKTGMLAGFEALVRWEHPEYGLISPNDFIPIAEATGLIVPLGADVLAQACRDAQRWISLVGQDKLPFISVNLSLRQLSESNFIEHARHLIAETGILPSKLKLEITESTLMTNPEESIRKLQEIRNLGVELSIDDFGTGYSSLAYLHRLPVNTLKIDKSFVSRINQPNDREIVRIITELGSILSLKVIAEGVERAEDIEALQSMGCGYGQGFYFSKPLDAEEAEGLIVKPRRWL